MLGNARRTFRHASFTLAPISLVLISLISLGAHEAQGQVVHADADYDAAGYVTPAGMAPPSMYQGSVQPVGFFSGSVAGNCDAYGGCDVGGCDGLGCDSGGCDGCGGGGSGGLLGTLAGGGGGGGGCLSCFGGGSGGSGFSNLRHLCFFCRGSGCSACQMVGNGQILGMMAALLPYREAGLCAQRWYDLSAEAVFLTHDYGGPVGGATSNGIGGPIVLRLQDADNGGETEAGLRLSGSLIFGAGGNIEATWMGGHEWNSTASYSDPNLAPNLFSFISDFGDLPVPGAGGFDDSDRSITQSVSGSSEYDSVELNYRRRTVGPYCRFQGSWLVGLRYIRYQDAFGYSALGENDNTVNANLPRFCTSDEDVDNRMFGGQVGFDFWWNVVSGVNVGVGAKGAWLKNDIDRNTLLTANSLGPLATAGTSSVLDGDETGTIVGDFEAKLIYRLSHSWSFRTAYYVTAIEDVAFGSVDIDSLQGFLQAGTSQARAVETDSLVLQGFSVGAEYIW